MTALNRMGLDHLADGEAQGSDLGFGAKVEYSTKAKSPLSQWRDSPADLSDADSSEKALREFKYACEHWLPKMTPQHRAEAMKCVAEVVGHAR
jgi:hypothetical protein